MKKMIRTSVMMSFALILGATIQVKEATAQVVLNNPIWGIEATADTWFANDNNTRGMAYNAATGNLLVVSRSGGLNIKRINASTGAIVGEMSVAGITGGTFTASLIDVSPSGRVFVANLTTNADTSPFKIYSWANETAEPVEIYAGNVSGTAFRFGDSFRADFTDGKSTLYAGGSGNPNLAKFAYNSATNTATVEQVFNFGAANNPVQRAVRGMSPIAGQDSLIINEFEYEVKVISTVTGQIGTVVPASVFPSKESLWIDFKAVGDVGIATVFPSSLVAAGQSASIINLNTRQEVAFTAAGANGNGNGAGASLLDIANKRLYLLATNNHIAAYDISAFLPEGTSVEIDNAPTAFRLNANYPNPFNPSTNISFELPVQTQVQLSVYSITGQLITTLVNEVRPAGQHSVTFDASELASGVYLYRIVAGDFAQTQKMVLMK